MSDIYRLVYASKNLLTGSEDEAAAAVVQILSTSQRNNAARDVTGALLFNRGAFAQVLEGPRRAVEDTFERIQRDERHGDVTVLQCGTVAGRAFGNWSMAFVGRSARGQAMWQGLASQSGFDLTRMDGDDVFAMLHGLVSEEEGMVAAPAAPLAPAALDVDRLRVELADLRPGPASGPTDAKPSDAKPVDVEPVAAEPVPVRPSIAAPPVRDDEPVIAVLKASLRAERLAAVELRGAIDDLRVALARQAEQLRAATRERDAWAERARVLAMTLCEAAEAVTSGTSKAVSRAA